MVGPQVGLKPRKNETPKGGAPTGGPPPQGAVGGGAKRGSGAREARRPSGTEASTPGEAAGASGGGFRAAGRDQAAHGSRLRAGAQPVVPQVAEQLVEVFSLPVEFISPAPAVWSSAPVVESITHVPASSPVPVVECLPHQQCFTHLCLRWNFLHPRQRCPNRRRQLWSTSHLRQLCFMRQLPVHLVLLLRYMLEVF